MGSLSLGDPGWSRRYREEGRGSRAREPRPHSSPALMQLHKHALICIYLRDEEKDGSSVSRAVGVVGASGYAGVELLRLCAAHPDLDVVVATAGTNAGEKVAAHTPSLAG